MDTESPFDGNAYKKSLTCDYFEYTDRSSHIDALQQGSIGRAVEAFRKKARIKLVLNQTLPENTQARYVYARGRAQRGHIEYGKRVNALLLGHEARHGWQHLELPAELQNPDSAQGLVLMDRWMEGDARAVHFGVTLQTADAMGMGNKYAFNLLACLDGYQKQILEYSLSKTREICASPQKLKQAMRQAFDGWIARAPMAAGCYREGTEALLATCSTSRARAAFYKVARRGHHVTPCFTKAAMDPAYPQRLAAALGNLGGDMGNYLTETEGPAFNSAGYTRICDFRLERQVEAIGSRIAQRR